MLPLLALAPAIVAARAIPVEIRNESGTYTLWRNAQPYQVKGAGGRGSLDELAAIGGNSIRIWGDASKAYLDQAHALGLSVCVGLWIQHERHGFDYDDAAAVEQQIAAHCAVIDALKDHPAVLVWGIGNEVELQSTNPKVWDVIEAVAAHAKKVDPNHPTMTVVAHAPVDAVAFITERAPSIDILGCNSYGGLKTLANDIRKTSWKGPYMVTEWGTDGMWEVDKTDWGAEVEPDSTQKARQLIEKYNFIQSDAGRCIGSYVFHWGNKQETTPTWFNLFLENGEKVEAVDVLQQLWTGSPPAVPAPRIDSVRLNNKSAHKSIRIRAGETVTASYNLRRGNSDHMRIRWELLAESNDKRSGGDRESRPQNITLQVLQHTGSCMKFTAPQESGAYRLFLYLYGEQDKAATANIPFMVQ